MQPLVSVIIPVYNAEKFIGEAVESVLASSYEHLEVVCVDDGSTDGSLALLQKLAATDKRVRVLHQENAGVCRARNFAIENATGTYILPVDSDDRISPTFIAEAMCAITSDEHIKAVNSRAEFFGERRGEWKLPPFSLHLLARKNIMDNCALYRRADWERVGGYCEEIIAREDWDFWISVLKDGGEVVHLSETGLFYRILNSSKRVQDRKLKHHVINILNKRHPEFFQRELGGHLHYHRTYSRLLNRLSRVLCPQKMGINRDFDKLRYYIEALPYLFRHTSTGQTIYKGRNELRSYAWHGYEVVVKSFKKPNFINQLVYGFLRKSKAERSYLYAEKLLRAGIDTPRPVGFVERRKGLRFADSYYISLHSALPWTYIDLMKGKLADSEPYLREIGRVAGRMHEAGIIHPDFSRGNLLLGERNGKPAVEVVDLNRLHFHAVSIAEGVENFHHLPATAEMRRSLAEGYAEVRGADADALLAIWPKTEEMNSPEAGERY